MLSPSPDVNDASEARYVSPYKITIKLWPFLEALTVDKAT